MTREADFRPDTREALASRAGHRCSFPSCGASTIGPSAEAATKTSSTGMACHIYAASDGPAARRRNPAMSAMELMSINNGIWMCYEHGKLIDTDEATYSPDLLNYWRKLAESKAQLRQALGR